MTGKCINHFQHSRQKAVLAKFILRQRFNKLFNCKQDYNVKGRAVTNANIEA